MIAVFEEMAQAWEAQDWQRCADLFTPQGVLHSVMLDPVVGREAIYDRIIKFTNPEKRVEIRIDRIGRVGDALFVERRDEISFPNHSGTSPVVGVLEFEGRQISLWREYYDRAQLLRELGTDVDPTLSEPSVSRPIVQLTGPHK